MYFNLTSDTSGSPSFPMFLVVFFVTSPFGFNLIIQVPSFMVRLVKFAQPVQIKFIELPL